MRQSKLFTKTRKESPKDEVSKNASLLIRAGYIHKEMAGVYAYLPLGLMVLEKIKQIAREEMNAIGGEELIMTALQRKELWQQTDRWSDENVDVWFKSELKAGGEVGFGWSHEEPIADMLKQYISSFRDLPVFVYQFQTKFRNELRAKSGIMRGREFVMKDMYSFCIDEQDHTKFYNQTIEAYKRFYARLGLGNDTFVTFASGGAFTKFSHEFQTVAETGEDKIFLNREKGIAVNEEVLNEETLKSLGVSRDELTEVATAEVGNIFNFGTQKSEALGLFYTNEKGEKTPVFMGSYGIGITRVMGLMVDKFSDEKGIIWPDSASPFNSHLIEIKGSEETTKRAEALYAKMQEISVTTLYDDRDVRAGEKFADADLIGIPWHVIVSDRGNIEKTVEVKHRRTGKTRVMPETEFLTGTFTELAE